MGCNFEPGRKQDTETASIWYGFGDQCSTWTKLATFDYAPERGGPPNMVMYTYPKEFTPFPYFTRL